MCFNDTAFVIEESKLVWFILIPIPATAHCQSCPWMMVSIKIPAAFLSRQYKSFGHFIYKSYLIYAEKKSYTPKVRAVIKLNRLETCKLLVLSTTDIIILSPVAVCHCFPLCPLPAYCWWA